MTEMKWFFIMLSVLFLLNGIVESVASEISSLCSHFPQHVIDSFSDGEDLETICARFFNQSRQNLVFIIVDDLRYMLDSDPFSNDVVPNLLELSLKPNAASFTNAQAVKSVCTPSRVAILTGRRPRQSGNYGLDDKFYTSNLKTFPGILAEHGYLSYAFGKIFDSRSFDHNVNNIDVCDPSAQLGGRKVCSFADSFGVDRIKCIVASPSDDPFDLSNYSNKEFTEPCTYLNRLGKSIVFGSDDSLPAEERKYIQATPIPYQTCSWTPNQIITGKYDTFVPKETFALYKGNKIIDQMDFGVTTAAIDRIKLLHSQAVVPFFVAIGITKPHLPFSAPAEFFDYFNQTNFPAFYNRELKDESPHVRDYFDRTFASNLPDGLRPPSQEIKTFIQAYGINNPRFEDGVEKKPLPPGSHIRRAMYATVKFADYLIGHIYRELSAIGVLENTHVIITSDHGFQAGEYGRFGKWTTVEGATRIPLIFLPSHNFSSTFPGLNENKQIDLPVDHTDLFPTVLDLLGFAAETDYAKSSDNRNLGLKEVEKLKAGKSLVSCFVNISSQECNAIRSLSVTEYDNFAGKGDQIALRSKYFRYIYFSDNNDEYLFDYRGGDFYRNIERENCIHDKDYKDVLEYFRKEVKHLQKQGDDVVFSKFVGQTPFDVNYSRKRGVNQAIV